MSLRDRPYLLFFSLAVGTFVVAHVGFEIFARVWMGRNTALEAVSETIYYSATQPFSTGMLLAPFVLIGWMAASLAMKQTLRDRVLLFIAGAAVVGLMYFRGHMGAEQAIQNQAWTASALSVGLLPFQSIPVLFLILVIRWLMGRKRCVEKL